MKTCMTIHKTVTVGFWIFWRLNTPNFNSFSWSSFVALEFQESVIYLNFELAIIFDFSFSLRISELEIQIQRTLTGFRFSREISWREKEMQIETFWNGNFQILESKILISNSQIRTLTVSD